MENGRIMNYRKNSGYSIIPNELVQNYTLSLQAIGLLVNLESLPEDWKLYKTELYRRWDKNKRSSIENAWQELVVQNYILQFRKRVEKTYHYLYLFSVRRFSKEDERELVAEREKEGYELYFSEKQEQALASESLSKERCKPVDNSAKKKELWDVENQQSKKPHDTAVSWDVDFEQLKTNTYILNTNKEEEEEKNINLNQLDNEEFKELARWLHQSGVPIADTLLIVDALWKEPGLFNWDVLKSQMGWCREKGKMEGIADFPTYFLNGLRMKLPGAKLERLPTPGEEKDRGEHIPLFNWLND